MSKVSIIGAGFVGSTIAYALMLNGTVSQMVIIDINNEKALGEVMDLNHGISFVNPIKIRYGNYKDLEGSDIIIITAGANQQAGETRLDLASKNVNIFKKMIPEITGYCNNAILLIVSNPVDILTYVTYKLSGLPKNHVIGSGTVLDSSRFKYLLSQHTGVDARNIHAYIIGEHGDSEVPIWSTANIAGMSMDQFCSICNKCSGDSKNQIFNNVKNSAYQIIQKKGATYYAIGLSVKRIVECILRNEHSILTVSSFIEGEYGLSDVCVSLPSIISDSGIETVLEIPISEYEKELLKESSEIIKNSIKELNI